MLFILHNTSVTWVSIFLLLHKLLKEAESLSNLSESIQLLSDTVGMSIPSV